MKKFASTGMLVLLLVLVACATEKPPNSQLTAEPIHESQVPSTSIVITPASILIATTSVATTSEMVERTTLSWPEVITPEIRKSMETIYRYMYEADFRTVNDEYNAEATAKRFFTLGIPEIVKVNLVEEVIKNEFYIIQYIDVNGQDYYAYLDMDSNFGYIAKGKGNDEVTLFKKHVP